MIFDIFKELKIKSYNPLQMGSPKSPVKLSNHTLQVFPHLKKEQKLYSPNFKLQRPMGFEFTFERLGSYKGYSPESMSGSYQLLKTILRENQFDCCSDDGCLEITTPAFYHSHDVLNYFNILRHILPKYMVPKNPWSTGGGCHIHFNLAEKIGQKLTKKDEVFVFNIAAIHHNRPWLTYALQDPYDDDSSEYAPFGHYFKLYVNRATNFFVKYSLGDKSLQFRYDHGYRTIELRYFDAVGNWRELEDHIKVANHIIKLAKVPLMNTDYFTEETFDDEYHRKGWVKLKKDAGLKYLTDSKLEDRLLLEHMKIGENIDAHFTQMKADENFARFVQNSTLEQRISTRKI